MMSKGKEIKGIRRRVRLRTAIDVQRALARLYRDLWRGDIETALAGKMAYVLTVMLKAMELGDVETRLQALEQTQTKR